MRALVLFLVWSLPALAQDACPAVPDRTADTDELFAALRGAADPGAATFLTAALWQIWTAAPDAQAQDVLDDGMAMRLAGDLAGSVARLGVLVARCPDYAEGWNQRAFSAFLMRDYAAALADLDRALAIEPRHLGALTGRAMTLTGLGRLTEAQADLRAALALNPWLAERALLREPPGITL